MAAVKGAANGLRRAKRKPFGQVAGTDAPVTGRGRWKLAVSGRESVNLGGTAETSRLCPEFSGTKTFFICPG